MSYDEILVLIPSHGIEDFPTELGEPEATGLLNMFAAACHPWVLAQCDGLPQPHRSDDPPEELAERLIFIPPVCDDWLPHDWAKEARDQGATIIDGASTREEILRVMNERLGGTQSAESDGSDVIPPFVPMHELPAEHQELVHDFFALGTVRLLLELLTQHMHHFDMTDDEAVARDTTAAGLAFVDGDLIVAREKLRSAFETLTEARERFYPVDCYLLDLCLLAPDSDQQALNDLIQRDVPVNFLLSGSDLHELAESRPEQIQQMQARWQSGHIDFVGGEDQEFPVPLVPLASALADFDAGRARYAEILGKYPRAWGRRRFGFSTLLPQILKQYNYHCALHFALDEGIYPDEEQGKVSWEGCDGSVIDATTRLPLAADSAVSFLRFPARLAETIEQDMVAALTFARWPDMKTPWFGDLIRMQRYSSSLGRFVSYNDFAQETDAHGRHASFHAREYLAPFLIYDAVRKVADPVTRFARRFERRASFDEAEWMNATASVLRSKSVVLNRQLESLLESSAEEETGDTEVAAATAVEEFHAQSLRQLAELISRSKTDAEQLLIVNPSSFARRIALTDDDLMAGIPDVDAGPTASTKSEESSSRSTTVEVPACGFRVVSAGEIRERLGNQSGVDLVQEGVIRNEFVEVLINENTGGIARVKVPGRRGNRLSQQVAYRFPNELSWSGTEEEGETKSWYSVMVADEISTLVSSPSVGCVRSTGRILNPADQSVVARFSQTVTVHRGIPDIKLDIEFTDIQQLPDGDPWSNYFAARFAWHDPGAALTRSVLGQAQGFRGERIESPHYFEIASDDERTTIASHGRPYHRKIDMRMMDSILIVGSESSRRFQFTIGLDQEFPMEFAQNALRPLPVFHSSTRPVTESGWLFHVNARNVKLMALRPLLAVPQTDENDATIPQTPESTKEDAGFAVRLVETEGRRARVELRTFKTPKRARQRTFDGRTVADLLIEDDAVILDMAGYEIVDVELRF